MATCVTCGVELHPERAEKYDYCTGPDCRARERAPASHRVDRREQGGRPVPRARRQDERGDGARPIPRRRPDRGRAARPPPRGLDLEPGDAGPEASIGHCAWSADEETWTKDEQNLASPTRSRGGSRSRRSPGASVAIRRPSRRCSSRRRPAGVRARSAQRGSTPEAGLSQLETSDTDGAEMNDATAQGPDRQAHVPHDGRGGRRVPVDLVHDERRSRSAIAIRAKRDRLVHGRCVLEQAPAGRCAGRSPVSGVRRLAGGAHGRLPPRGPWRDPGVPACTPRERSLGKCRHEPASPGPSWRGGAPRASGRRRRSPGPAIHPRGSWIRPEASRWRSGRRRRRLRGSSVHCLDLLGRLERSRARGRESTTSGTEVIEACRPSTCWCSVSRSNEGVSTTC